MFGAVMDENVVVFYSVNWVKMGNVNQAADGRCLQGFESAAFRVEWLPRAL